MVGSNDVVVRGYNMIGTDLLTSATGKMNISCWTKNDDDVVAFFVPTTTVARLSSNNMLESLVDSGMSLLSVVIWNLNAKTTCEVINTNGYPSNWDRKSFSLLHGRIAKIDSKVHSASRGNLEWIQQLDRWLREFHSSYYAHLPETNMKGIRSGNLSRPDFSTTTTCSGWSSLVIELHSERSCLEWISVERESELVRYLSSWGKTTWTSSESEGWRRRKWRMEEEEEEPQLDGCWGIYLMLFLFRTIISFPTSWLFPTVSDGSDRFFDQFRV